MINIGADGGSIKNVRREIIELLKIFPKESLTFQVAVEAIISLRDMCKVTNTTISHCNLTVSKGQIK